MEILLGLVALAFPILAIVGIVMAVGTRDRLRALEFRFGRDRTARGGIVRAAGGGGTATRGAAPRAGCYLQSRGTSSNAGGAVDARARGAFHAAVLAR